MLGGQDAEGGSAGSVNIITRKPLQFAEQMTIEGSVGAVHSDLPGDTKPQVGLFNWKNDAGTVGVLVQGFYEKRGLRREGQEVPGGFFQIGATDPAGGSQSRSGRRLYPDLHRLDLVRAGPRAQGRRAGHPDQAHRQPDPGPERFYSKLEADNFNRNYMLWNSRFRQQPAPVARLRRQQRRTDPRYVHRRARLPDSWGVYDQISRPKPRPRASYITLDADWQVSDNFGLKFQAGTTSGKARPRARTSPK